jgi:hypothetical protein
VAASDIQKIISWESAQIGKPYQWGAIGPDAYDCSGLQQAAFNLVGYPLTRTTYTQILQGSSVGIQDLQPGDLIFPDAGHVQLYIGGGEVIEAPYTGSQVRRVKMWGFWQARRYLDGGADLAANPNQILSATDTAQSQTGSSGGSPLSVALKAPAWIAKNYLRVLEAIGGIVAIILGVVMINKDTFKEVGETVGKFAAIPG